MDFIQILLPLASMAVMICLSIGFVFWVKNWVKHTGLNDIAFSGGVALNIIGIIIIALISVFLIPYVMS